MAPGLPTLGAVEPSPQDPHHTINLLLQAPGPVLHPACREEKSVRGPACSSTALPRPPGGDPQQPPLQNPVSTREETEAGNDSLSL